MWLYGVYGAGVVDSEDLPLNVSRESMQDSSLYQRIRSVLTRRFLRFLDQESKRDREKFQQFSKEFGHFLKEGIVTDVTFQVRPITTHGTPPPPPPPVCATMVSRARNSIAPRLPPMLRCAITDDNNHPIPVVHPSS